MENTYGIGVANRYALFLDDESDPLETIKSKEQEKELKKKTKAAEKENKVKTEVPAKGKPAPPQKKVIKDAPNHKLQDNKREEGKPTQRTNDSKPERTYTKFNNENREERNNRRNREDRPYNGPSENNREDRPPRREQGDSFENRRGRPLGNKTGGRGGGGAPRRTFDDRRGKREFDRQSGSDKTHGYRGVKPVDKRDGGGAHNWGSHKDVIDEADKTNEETWVGDKPETTEPAPEVPKDQPEQAEPEATPAEEEAKELTLDEWKAQRAGRSKPQYNIRKAGEGEDPTQWKKMYELSKKKAEEEAIDMQDTDDEEYDASEYPQRVGRQKHVLDINIHFNDSRRGGAGRGRGGRGGRGGGRNTNREPRGDRPVRERFRNAEEQVEERGGDARNAPKVDDERDFPSLG